MQRRTLIKAALAGAGMTGVIRRVLAAGINPAKPGLQRLKGRVTVNEQTAVEGMLIKGGDTVITGADGEAIYVIGQDAFLQRASSEVRFGSATADFMRVVSGRLLSVFGHGEKRLILPTATIGIRGTACYIETDAMKSYFCLCYGEAEVVPTAAPAEKEIIRTRHHDHPIYIHGDPAMPTSMVPATVINHSDLELELLEGLVGRLPPFWNATESRY